jgi:hypothetical protein
MKHVTVGAIVSLMYEGWEFRAEDLDLDYIKARGIRVAATNERHPEVDVFSYLGELAVRQIHLAGLSLARNRFVLYCNNPFGPYLARTLGALCTELIVVDDNDDPTPYADSRITWAGNLEQLKDQLPRTDIAGIVLAAYPFDQEWIGIDGMIHPQYISDNFPGAVLLRFAGHVDEASLSRHGIEYYPSSVPIGHMGSLLSELGPDPVIRLQAGGLKAAEVALAGSTTYRDIPILEWL